MVIDTGLFIEHLRVKDKSKTTLYRLADTDQELFTSAVSLYELYMGATSREKMEDVNYLTGDLNVLPFTEVVAAKSAEIYHFLRRKNKMIEFRDIFIAATCIVHELPIATLNKKHFDRIPELHIATI